MTKNYLIISLLLLSAVFELSCQNENGEAPSGPSATPTMFGILCTLAIDHTGNEDTLMLDRENWDQIEWVGEFRSYSPEYATAGDEISFEPIGGGSNAYHIVFKKPYIFHDTNEDFPYLGAQKFTAAPDDEYPEGCEDYATAYSQLTPETEFIITRSGEKFTIESKNIPGAFLNPVKFNGATYPEQNKLHFCKDHEHSFFILQRK
jgi:hypothetical protein